MVEVDFQSFQTNRDVRSLMSVFSEEPRLHTPQCLSVTSQPVDSMEAEICPTHTLHLFEVNLCHRLTAVP